MGSVWPIHVDGLHMIGFPQSKMHAGIVAAQVAGGGIDQSEELPAAGADADGCAVGIAPAAARKDGPHCEPMAPPAGNIAIGPGGAIGSKCGPSFRAAAG